jgi:hypothetical protein
MSATHFSGPLVVGTGSYESVITTKTLSAADDGKVLGLNLAGGFTVTLPSVSGAVATAGMTFTFRVETQPTTAYIITEGAGDANIIIGGFATADVIDVAAAPSTTGATNVNLVASVADVGDHFTLTCNGTSWFLSDAWISTKESATLT